MDNLEQIRLKAVGKTVAEVLKEYLYRYDIFRLTVITPSKIAFNGFIKGFLYETDVDDILYKKKIENTIVTRTELKNGSNLFLFVEEIK